MTITLPPELEKKLEAAARAKGVPVDAYAKAILEQAVDHHADRATLLSEIDRIRAMTPPGPQTDSAELLRLTQS